MELKVISLADDYTHLAVVGKLDNLGVIEIEDPFLKLVEERKLGVLIDVSGVTFTGSRGLRMFLQAARTLNKEKKAMVLFNPLGTFKAVLLDSGIEKAVTITDNLEAALAKAGG